MKRFISHEELARDSRFKRARSRGRLLESLPDDVKGVVSLMEHVAPKLRERVAREGTGGGPPRVMSDAEVDRFIAHYERITRHLLEEMPARADLVIDVDHGHHPAALRINRSL